MRFWDSSALTPLFVGHASTAAMSALFDEDPAPAIWWATPVEGRSAIERRLRNGELDGEGAAIARARLHGILIKADLMPPTDALRDDAERLLGRYPLPAADALQLAAALMWAQGRPNGAEVVTLDQRLADAARAEGFAVLGLGP